MFQQLTDQLVHDLKVSWKKTALLGVLLVVGLCFWIPLLIRAVSGGKTEAAVSTAANRVAPAAPQSTADDKSPAETLPKEFHWANAESVFATDPLLQSAELAGSERDPFQIDAAQFPPPVLFAESAVPPNKQPSARDENRGTLRTLDGAVLKSTVISSSRRAAFINSRLYYEGRSLNLGDATYRIAAIYPRRVVLRRGDEVYELSIETPKDVGSQRVGTAD